MNKFTKIKTRLFFLLIWFFVISFSLFLLPWKDLPVEQAQIIQNNEIPIIRYVNYFAETEIQANIAAVWDIEEQRFLYQKNINQQVPLASLTKLMTALIATENLENDEIVTFDHQARQLDDSLSLPIGSKWRSSDLIDLLLIRSSNAASRAIALAVEDKLNANFTDLMNKKARELAMESYFINESGLDVGGGSYGGSFGSAQDIIKLIEYIIRNHPDLLSATKHQSINRRALTGEISSPNNTNQEVGKINGLIASKTGFTGQAGGNLAIVFDANLNRPVIIIVLSSTRQERFNDVINLYEASRQQIIDGH